MAINTGITPTSTDTVQGSQTPVESNAYPGWPDAANPALSGATPCDLSSYGDDDNILGDAGGTHPAHYALGTTPD
jgi:hypothetical protein